jgi:hypothetical protein
MDTRPTHGDTEYREHGSTMDGKSGKEPNIRSRDTFSSPDSLPYSCFNSYEMGVSCPLTPLWYKYSLSINFSSIVGTHSKKKNALKIRHAREYPRPLARIQSHIKTEDPVIFLFAIFTHLSLTETRSRCYWQLKTPGHKFITAAFSRGRVVLRTCEALNLTIMSPN